jgi:hypothetical protein
MIDVVCYYADLGRPYRSLMERMCASAKQHIRCRTVILTPTPMEWMRQVFDTVAPHQSASYKEVTKDNLCQQRAEAMMSWGAYCNRPTFFVDPDLEFRAMPALPEADLCLLWRNDKLAMPVNTGFIATSPFDGQKDFWLVYGNTVVNLPTRIHGWWCDQLGFSCLLGNQHKPGDRLKVLGAEIALLDAREHCDVPENASEKAWAVHYKGNRKGAEWGAIYAGSVFNEDATGAAALNHLRIA